jgi:hypothetical protein
MVYEVRFVGYEITGGHCEYTIHVIGGQEEGTWQFSRRYASMRNFHD